MGTAQPEFNLISSEDVEGTTVYDPNGNEIGKVDHLMIDKISGQVRYAIMSFGGFLGLGHKHYSLPWSSLT
jgi:sporulation protein YlmC with PRC-barrel domain